MVRVGTAQEIARTLALGIFSYRRNIVVPNVSWGFLPWEADLLVLSGSSYLYEVEIKVSIADLKRDSRKQKWLIQSRINSFYANTIRGMWYAMPVSVWAHKDAAGSVPDHAGVIVLDHGLGNRAHCRVVRSCKVNKDAVKVGDSDRFKLARLGVMRYWTRQEKDVIRPS